MTIAHERWESDMTCPSTYLTTDLTSEMLKSDAYKSLTFKKYNFNALAPHPLGGHLHPLLKVRAQFRKIFVRMGFEEVAEVAQSHGAIYSALMDVQC